MPAPATCLYAFKTLFYRADSGHYWPVKCWCLAGQQSVVSVYVSPPLERVKWTRAGAGPLFNCMYQNSVWLQNYAHFQVSLPASQVTAWLVRVPPRRVSPPNKCGRLAHHPIYQIHSRLAFLSFSLLSLDQRRARAIVHF